MSKDILEALKKYGESQVHASEFLEAIEALGLQEGCPIVDAFLVDCVIDDRGMIDFSNVRKESLKRISQEKFVLPESSRKKMFQQRTSQIYYESPQTTERLHLTPKERQTTVARQEMRKGLDPRSPDSPGELQIVAMKREQLLAAVRMLANGQMHVHNFEKKIKSVLDIHETPADIIKLLTHFGRTGEVSFSRYTKVLNRHLETKQAAVLALSHKPDERQVSAIIKKLSQSCTHIFSVRDFELALRASVVPSRPDCIDLPRLKRILRNYLEDDEDHDLLFRFLSKDGRFITTNCIIDKLIAGSYTEKRRRLATQVFSELDHVGDGLVLIEDLRQSFSDQNAQLKEDFFQRLHPDAIDKEKKEIKKYAWHRFYATLSAACGDNDDLFATVLDIPFAILLRDTMRPLRGEYIRSRNGEPKTKPLAGQHHGDIVSWQTRPSNLERRQEALPGSSTLPIRALSLKSGVQGPSVIEKQSSFRYNDWGHVTPQEQQIEMDQAFGVKRSSTLKQVAYAGAGGHFLWKSPARSSPFPPSPPPAQSAVASTTTRTNLLHFATPSKVTTTDHQYHAEQTPPSASSVSLKTFLANKGRRDPY